jgi:transcriptional regulator with XRE-family HTH domain
MLYVMTYILHAPSICDSIWYVMKNIEKHIKPLRLEGLPADLKRELLDARHRRGWSQTELGRRLGLPQPHISDIESGKITPRLETLVDLVRVLGYDLLLVPRSLVPAVQALVRDERSHEAHAGEGERPLYATDNEEQRQEPGKRHNEV